MKWMLAIAAVLVLAAWGLPTEDPPAELGAVHWGRDLEAAKRQSAETGKPVLVLFQEVPG